MNALLEYKRFFKYTAVGKMLVSKRMYRKLERIYVQFLILSSFEMSSIFCHYKRKAISYPSICALYLSYNGDLSKYY